MTPEYGIIIAHNSDIYTCIIYKVESTQIVIILNALEEIVTLV